VTADQRPVTAAGPMVVEQLADSDKARPRDDVLFNVNEVDWPQNDALFHRNDDVMCSHHRGLRLLL